MKRAIPGSLASIPRALGRLAIAIAAMMAILAGLTVAVVMYIAVTGHLPDSRLITEHEAAIYICGPLLFFAVSVVFTRRRAEQGMETSKNKGGRPRTRVALPEVEYADADYLSREDDIGAAPHLYLALRVSIEAVEALDKIAEQKNHGVGRYQSDPRRMSRNRLICRAINEYLAAEADKGTR